MAEIRMLFDNGEFCKVTCSVYPPMSVKGIQGHVTGNPCRDFDEAADNATNAAYKVLFAKGLAEGGIQAAFSLNIRAGQSESNITSDSAGQSGGLAFAIAAANAKLQEKAPPGSPALPGLPPDIAATGVINGDGKIFDVKALDAKLEAAAGFVNENGMIFFPAKNGYTVPDVLEQRFKAKNIRFYDVYHFDEVFDILWSEIVPQPEPEVKKDPLKKSSLKQHTGLLLAVLLVLGMAAMGYFFLYQPQTPVSPLPPVSQPAPPTAADQVKKGSLSPDKNLDERVKPFVDKGFD